jgi:hypothetical protein
MSLMITVSAAQLHHAELHFQLIMMVHYSQPQG